MRTFRNRIIYFMHKVNKLVPKAYEKSVHSSYNLRDRSSPSTENFSRRDDKTDPGFPVVSFPFTN